MNRKTVLAFFMMGLILFNSIALAEEWRLVSAGGDVKTYRDTPQSAFGTSYCFDLWEMTIFKNAKAIKNIPFKYYKTRMHIDCEKKVYSYTDKYYYDASHKEVYKEAYSNTAIHKGMALTFESKKYPLQPGSFEDKLCTQKRTAVQKKEAESKVNTIKHLQQQIPVIKKEIANLKSKVMAERDPARKKQLEIQLKKKEDYLQYSENNLSVRLENQKK